MRKLNWLDMLIYKLFVWRWSPIFKSRPDLLKFFHNWQGNYILENYEWIKPDPTTGNWQWKEGK